MTLNPADAATRANFRRLYADIFWFGVLSGSTLAFLVVYLARLGASSFQVSLLTAGPALISLFISLPSGRWLEGKSFIRASFWAALFQRLGYLLLIPLPWFLGPHLQIETIIWITLLISLPGTILAIGFNAMFADVVPAEWRAEVVGRRNAIQAVSLTATTLASGQILDRVPHPLNYQIVFALGAIGALLSTYYVGQIRLAGVPAGPRLARPTGELARPGLQRLGLAARQAVGLRFLARNPGKPLLRLDLLRSSFGLFMVSYLAVYMFQYVGIPLFPLYFVNELKLKDSSISLGSSLFYAVMFLVSLRLSRMSARHGHRRLLVASTLSFSLYPLLMGLARSPALYYLGSLLGGAIWAVISASMINRLMENSTEGDRPAYMALHNLAFNLGILLGSLAGPVLAGWVGLRNALLVDFGLRVAAGVLIALWG